MDAKEIQEKIDILQKEVSTVIKGKDEVIRKVIMAILASGHVLLEDVPGLGKTTLAAIIANEMGGNLRVTSGPAISHAGDLAAILTNLSLIHI